MTAEQFKRKHKKARAIVARCGLVGMFPPRWVLVMLVDRSRVDNVRQLSRAYGVGTGAS